MIRTEYRVNPRWEDIAIGRGGDPGNCAIAHHLRNKYPEMTRVAVSERNIKFTVEGRRYEMATPLTAKKWQKQFDAWKAGKGSDPGPIDFYLRTSEALVTETPEKTDEQKVYSRERTAARQARLAAETPAEREARLKRSTAQRKARRAGVFA